MPDILAILTAERDKLNRAIEALGGEIGDMLGRIVREETPRTMSPKPEPISAPVKRHDGPK
jgi:hypothetical protein